MTRQEAFDLAARAIIKQGKPGQEPGTGPNSCSYLASNGNRCAIGWLLL